jgi:hypothetical protein
MEQRFTTKFQTTVSFRDYKLSLNIYHSIKEVPPKILHITGNMDIFHNIPSRVWDRHSPPSTNDDDVVSSSAITSTLMLYLQSLLTRRSSSECQARLEAPFEAYLAADYYYGSDTADYIGSLEELERALLHPVTHLPSKSRESSISTVAVELIWDVDNVANSNYA